MCAGRMHKTHGPSGLCGWCLFFCGYVPSVFAVILILAHIIPYYLFFLPRLHETYTKGVVSWIYCAYCVIFMTIAGVVLLTNFLFAICTPPGYVERVPWADMPVFRGQVNSSNMNEVHRFGLDGNLRYCYKCEIYKPDNAHHCRSCRRCVYHMDHHCPWINNCVGRDNAKYFLLFLTYIPLCGLHIGGTVAYSCLYHFDIHGVTGFAEEPILICSVVFSLLMGISFFFFAAHFLWLTFRGETTVGNVAYRDKGDQRLLKEEKERYLNDICGVDRRWWRLICPFRVVRPSHGTSLRELT
ncbi:putative palmitoyl acyltransferase 12 [Trypanosoma cruzi]|uniref:Palmitoyltransferase n=1 Tax=Trypanosoma cruzi TaxID=5693 RepID=A0A2V2X7U6_TRYCR|nr:putative palmitoyl acyltransferase 12 [Trypanosoma cruzi]